MKRQKQNCFPHSKSDAVVGDKGPGTTLQLHTDIQHNPGCSGGEIN